MNILFISHNGLTEPLGQSQVLAYLEALVPLGHRFELITFEPNRGSAHLPPLKREGIEHHPVFRTPGSSLRSKMRDLVNGLVVGQSILSQAGIDIIHARSLLPAALADALRSRQKRHIPLVFDLPGFLPQEFLDAAHWTKNDLRYQSARAAQNILIARSQGIAVGTGPALEMIRQRLMPSRSIPPVEIVPSCVDTDRFRPDPKARALTRKRFAVGTAPLLVYAGSLGSWYLHEEMVLFFAAVRQIRRDAKFLVVTRSDARPLLEFAEGLKVKESVFVVQAEPKDMPALLAGADMGLCLVAPAPSKRASSPVKMAEYLACGLPILVNAGVGDMEHHAGHCPAVRLLPDFSAESLALAAQSLPRLLTEETRQEARLYALENFHLKKVGAERYHRLYRRALGSR